jgi:hypothetical protein
VHGTHDDTIFKTGKPEIQWFKQMRKLSHGGSGRFVILVYPE